MNWQNASGYNKRSKVEAAISRYKHVIADTLKSRDDARRATEIAIAVKSLNRMRDLGQAICSRVRVAQLIPRRRQSTLRKLYATKCAIGRQVGRDVELWSGLCRARNLARRNLKRNGRESPGRPGVPGARVWLGEGRLRHGETRDPGPGPEVRSPVPRHQRQGLSTEGLRPRRHARSQLDKGEAEELLQRGTEWLAEEQDMLYAQNPGRYCSFSRPWTRQARTVRPSTSCPA